MTFDTAITFLVPFVYVVIALIRERHAVSFRGFFFVFAFFFYSVAGYCQYYEPVSPLYSVSVETFEAINLILFLCYIIFDIVYFSCFNTKKSADDVSGNVKTLDIDLPYGGALVLLLIALLCGAFVLYTNQFNLNNMLFRGGDENIERVDVFEDSGAVGLVLMPIRITISVVCFYLLSCCRYKILKLLGLVFLLFFIFPASSARYFIAATYIPIMLVCIEKFRKSRYLFTAMMFFGIFVIFPFLDLFRYTYDEDSIEKATFDPTEMFSTLNFDSYTSFAFVFEHEIVTDGYQLLGPLLFWFPRSLWPDKPEGSGHFVSDKFTLFEGGFSNISMNYLGEGYINFGIIGVFLFIILLALFAKKMDSVFWGKYKGETNNAFAPYYLYLLGMLTFVLRGDLMSGTAYTVAAVVAVVIVSVCVKLMGSKNGKNTCAD